MTFADDQLAILQWAMLKKFYVLGLTGYVKSPAWDSFLEENGIKRIDEPMDEKIILMDPCMEEKYLLVPYDLALKILTLGILP